MQIIWAEIRKELLMLWRDKAGLALLFIMPATLVVVMTLIQDAAFRVLSNEKVELVWIDLDQSTVSKTIAQKLKKSGYFTLIDSSGSDLISEEKGKALLSEGTYQAGIIIPEGFEKGFKTKVKSRVDSLLSQFGLVDSSAENVVQSNKGLQVKLLFDPLTQATYKTGVSNGITGLVNEMETQFSFKAFQAKLAARFPYNPSNSRELSMKSLITFQEEFVFKSGNGSLPTSVQHNIPAWTVFAVFFIVVSFSQRIVEERLSGVNKRIQSMGVAPSALLAGKAITYLLISLAQLLFILSLGFWFIPLLGLPALQINGSLLSLLLFTAPIALASGGTALLIGNWAKTRDQAASFGSVAIIILAALGGVWVPVFAMPSVLQQLSKLSPLNWALEGYYEIILRGAPLPELWTPILLLTLLFAITFGASTLIRR